MENQDSFENNYNCSDEIGHYAKKLNENEIEKLVKDTKLVSEFYKLKLEKEAKKNWDLFYKRNTINFFKDRHWTKREFQELADSNVNDKLDKKLILLELGCGVGNFFFPLIEEGTNYYIYACDFSPRAIELIKKNSLYDESKCKAFVGDLTNEQEFIEKFTEVSNGELVDVISLIFVLSAINPDKMKNVLNNSFKVMKSGGILIFRDYGLYDHAMIRFQKGHKISKNFYTRIDGTRAYYFSEEIVAELFQKAGFEIITNKYVVKQTVNKKESICVDRIFVQAKFRKP